MAVARREEPFAGFEFELAGAERNGQGEGVEHKELRCMCSTWWLPDSAHDKGAGKMP